MFGKTEKNKEMQNAWFYKQELVDKSYKTETSRCISERMAIADRK